MLGGEFTCKATENGGFLYVSDGGRVEISGGLVDGCLAESRAGAVSAGQYIVLQYVPHHLLGMCLVRADCPSCECATQLLIQTSSSSELLPVVHAKTKKISGVSAEYVE